jgi:hypothetical protein
MTLKYLESKTRPHQLKCSSTALINCIFMLLLLDSEIWNTPVYFNKVLIIDKLYKNTFSENTHMK